MDSKHAELTARNFPTAEEEALALILKGEAAMIITSTRLAPKPGPMILPPQVPNMFSVPAPATVQS